jgi:hypothetical protein
MFGLFDFIDNRLGKHHWYRKLTRGNWYLVEWTFPYSFIKKTDKLPAIREAVKKMNIDGEFPRWQRHYGRPVDYLWIILDKEIYRGEDSPWLTKEEREQIKIENKLFERNKRIDKLTKQE